MDIQKKLGIPPPNSCDTFVALPPATKAGVIFGKNSDRPKDEVQEVVYIGAQDHPGASKLQVHYVILLFLNSHINDIVGFGCVNVCEKGI